MDTERDVAYVGAFNEDGVAVLDISDREAPVVANVLDTCFGGLCSDSIDVKVRGNLLAVANEPIDPGAFGGVTLYDLSVDAFMPVERGQFEVVGGSTHNVFIDPGFPDRPFVYLANSNFSTADTVMIIDVSDLDNPTFVAELVPSDEAVGCQVEDCGIFGGPFASAHDLFVQEHPDTGKYLAYVAYWDAGLRIYDVSDPLVAVEIGAFDVDPAPADPEELPCCVHYAQPTPSGEYVLIEEEVGVGDTGDVRILSAAGCDGNPTSTCQLQLISSWQPPQGHARQAPSYEAFVDTGALNFGWLQRFFTWDVHNLDVRENEFLAASYSAGIRVVDISDKTNPTEVAFFIPESNVKDALKVGFQGREVWTAKYGADERIYASDFWTGFYIVEKVSAKKN
ncbi:MAG: hypothetical protein GWN53_16100 [Gammaproteobacteria bacterium]|nr:hypothetical protein [Gammaproteobacteria bacterium]